MKRAVPPDERPVAASLSDWERLLADAAWRRAIRQKLIQWYKGHARDLPWRRTRDPYAIWVSEIMLQQTQVATVGPYYDQFLAAFPTIRHLAQAKEADVLRRWEGLGYYRRARQLHRAAQQIVEQHGGEFPRQREAVHALPGIGRYTAGAILSIAFDAREPILEANTIRLFCRLIGYPHDPRASAGQQVLWRAAEVLLPRQSVGTFNQSLMELGSLVCTPRQPDCPACPLQRACPTQRLGQQASIPRAAPRMVYEDLHEVAVVVWRADRVFVRQCAEGERWAGLWDFPRGAIEQPAAAPSVAQLRSLAEQHAHVQVGPITPCLQLKHGVTRFRITLAVYQTTARSQPRSNGAGRWVTLSELEAIPLSVTGRKIAQHLTQTD